MAAFDLLCQLTWVVKNQRERAASPSGVVLTRQIAECYYISLTIFSSSKISYHCRKHYIST